jgi:hypothetical protein
VIDHDDAGTDEPGNIADALDHGSRFEVAHSARRLVEQQEPRRSGGGACEFEAA